jgi:hypothetical protein
VGLILEVPDFGKLQELLESDEGREAEKSDGVRSETILVLEEG